LEVILKDYRNLFFVFTIIFFLLGIVNISFSIIGLLCFIIPFLQYKKYKNNIWCKYYCPRAGFLGILLKKKKFGLSLPNNDTLKKFRKYVLYYFSLNVFFASMSTLMVFLNRMEPFDFVRILMIFRAPFELIQLIHIDLPNWLIHFSYRIYSIMFTSTLVGIIIGIIYKPKAWCSVCPIGTLTRKVKSIS
jgi:hypothetical protein